MAMLCRDICRDLFPDSEFFDYGLWIPAGKYRPDSDVSESSESVGGDVEVSTTVVETAPPPPPINEKESDRIWKEITGGASTCSIDQAADYARKLGFAPSLKEISNLQSTKGSNVTKKDVESWIERIYHADTVDSLVQFFAHYDTKNTGTLTKIQMSNLLRMYGEPLTDAEFNAIAADLGIVGNTVDYRAFVAKLLE